MAEISWTYDRDAAFDTARHTGLPVLMDFKSGKCRGCRRLDAVTYPDEDVSRFLSDNFVPVLVDYDSETVPLRKYNVFWTPSILFVDPKGVDHFRLEGYLPPGLFLPCLKYGRAMIAYRSHRFEEAVDLFERVVWEHPGSSRAAPSMYFGGIARHKTDESYTLESLRDRLMASYPDSEWASRTSVWVKVPAQAGEKKR